MRLAFACLLVAAPFICAQADEISPTHRGAWAENGDCQQARRIVIGENTIKLVEPGRARILTDGDEAVFNGETLINASLPSRKEEEPVLGFSAKVLEADGELKLVTEGLENGGGFSGTFKLCKGEPTMRTASKEKNKASRRSAVVRTAPGRPSPYFQGGTLLGGLY